MHPPPPFPSPNSKQCVIYLVSFSYLLTKKRINIITKLVVCTSSYNFYFYLVLQLFLFILNFYLFFILLICWFKALFLSKKNDTISNIEKLLQLEKKIKLKYKKDEKIEKRNKVLIR